MQCPEGQEGNPRLPTSESHRETEASLEARSDVLGETSIYPLSMRSVAHKQITELGLQLPLGAILQGCVFITWCSLQLLCTPLLVFGD